MSADASTFSLERVVKGITPHLDKLPFKRLRDYTGSLEKNEVNGTVYFPDLSPDDVLTPSTLDRDVKAYRFLVDVVVIGPRDGVDEMPYKVEYKHLVLVYPKKGSPRWLFQDSIFRRKNFDNPHLRGTSTMVWVDDESLADLVHPDSAFPSDLRSQIDEWKKALRNAHKN